ncbi:hypothetical protein QVD17_31675 [Tagetes erecta]|uniref:Uncharacterized protein n=1 Tax=Tagetes erecta TaxID=13708 RepID=A0AAD8K884_TARER|nr:hypothetical protein QVD17_31675 [Tagetes erecta]
MNHIGLPSFQLHDQDNSINLKLSQLPRCITKLELSHCNLGDGDIPCYISELVTLQVLDLRSNTFTRLPSTLISQIRCLKLLILSRCRNLVELPDLPSSIAILKANECDSLESIGDLSKYKCLWKVSLWRWNEWIGDNRHVNAVEDRFMSVKLPYKVPEESYDFDKTKTLITLQLPKNWYSEFSGFIIHCNEYVWRESERVIIKGEMSMDDHHDAEVFDENWEFGEVGYAPFASLRHTSWWNCNYTNLSFQFLAMGQDPKVQLVRRKSKVGDSTRDFWDEEYEDCKTFKIIDDDSNPSKLKIVWHT